MKFSRYESVMSKTFALRAFNEHETEINKHYWSFVVASEFCKHLARKENKNNALSKTAILFHAFGPNAGRIPETVSEWLSASKELENWLRLSAVVSASSYLEAYIRQVIRSALMSDPLSRFGNSKVVDGMKILKEGREISCEREIELITKGNWSKRVKNFKLVFGQALPILSEDIKKLDKIRNLRNEFAHGFGRSLKVPEPINRVGGSPSKISEKGLIELLSVISKVASDIDCFLLKEFIGSFEILFFYHKIKDNINSICNLNNPAYKCLSKALKQDVDLHFSINYCKGLIHYYQSL